MKLDLEERHNLLVDLANEEELYIVGFSDEDIIIALAQEILALKRKMEQMSQYINWPE